MASLPANLRPLPTMPYSERPFELPLDIEECRTAIWKCSGNISAAAEVLKVPSQRLRIFVKKSPYLSREMEEAREQIVDKAEDIIREGLEDEDDKARRDQAARFVLNSGFAKARGWGSAATPGISVKAPGGMVVVQWQDGTRFSGAEPTIIEGEAVPTEVRDESPE